MKAVAVRSLRTFIQTFAAVLTIDGVIKPVTEIDWVQILGVAFTAAIYSAAMGILSVLPETNMTGILEITENVDPSVQDWNLKYDGNIENIKDGDILLFNVTKQDDKEAG